MTPETEIAKGFYTASTDFGRQGNFNLTQAV